MKEAKFKLKIQLMSTYVGEILSKRLEKMGKTQGWLAEKAGVSNNAVSKWIKTGKISRVNAVTVASLLQVSLDDLLSDGIAPPADGEQKPPLPTRFKLPSAPRSDSDHVHADVLAELNVISQREAQLLNWFRMATEDSKGIIEDVARSIEKSPLTSVVDNQTKGNLSGA